MYAHYNVVDFKTSKEIIEVNPFFSHMTVYFFVYIKGNTII